MPGWLCVYFENVGGPVFDASVVFEFERSNLALRHDRPLWRGHRCIPSDGSKPRRFANPDWRCIRCLWVTLLQPSSVFEEMGDHVRRPGGL